MATAEERLKIIVEAQDKASATMRGIERQTDSLSRLALEADLRNAFLRGEIEPFFQPIVNLDTGETKFATTSAGHSRNVAELQAWLAANR